MSEPYIYEFLFRGRPLDGFGAGDPAYHVIVGQYVEVPGGREPQLVTSQALTPDQAKAAGFALPALLKGINSAVMASRDAAMAERDVMRTERDAALAERDAARAGRPEAPEPTAEPEPTPETQAEPADATAPLAAEPEANP